MPITADIDDIAAAPPARPAKQEKKKVVMLEKEEPKCAVVDILDDDDDAPVQVVSHRGKAEKRAMKEMKGEGAKREKREMKGEPEKKKKKSKVKKEKRDDDAAVQSRHKDKKDKKQASASSSSSSSSSESESNLYRRFKPFSKVELVNLVRKAELNGMTGVVVHPSCSVCPCPPGCILVRIETGREIACKGANITPLKSFHVGPNQAPQHQAQRLTQILSQIKMNVDGILDPPTRKDATLLDLAPDTVQGGIGYVL